MNCFLSKGNLKEAFMSGFKPINNAIEYWH